MVESNFSTAYYGGKQLSAAYYGGKQLQYCILILHAMVVSNFSTAYYGGKQLQYCILWW